MMPKKISLILAFCVMLNNSAALGVIDTTAVDMSTPIIQTSVFQLVSLVRLPFTISASLLQEQVPLLPGINKPGKACDDKSNKDKQDAGRKKDCAFSFSNPINEMRLSLQTGNFNKAGISVSVTQPRASGVPWVNMLLFWLGFKYIFLLACLAALSKSSLPWEISYSCVRTAQS